MVSEFRAFDRLVTESHSAQQFLITYLARLIQILEFSFYKQINSDLNVVLNEHHQFDDCPRWI